MNDYRTELATVIADTSPGANTDIFGADFQLKRAGNLLRITAQCASDVTLSLVPSSGTAVALGTVGASAVTFEVAVDQGRTWNAQINGAVAVHHLVVVEVQA